MTCCLFSTKLRLPYLNQWWLIVNWIDLMNEFQWNSNLDTCMIIFIQENVFKKTSSEKWQPFCLGLQCVYKWFLWFTIMMCVYHFLFQIVNSHIEEEVVEFYEDCEWTGLLEKQHLKQFCICCIDVCLLNYVLLNYVCWIDAQNTHKKTHQNSPSWASCGVPIVIILEKCINPCAVLKPEYSGTTKLITVAGDILVLCIPKTSAAIVI